MSTPPPDPYGHGPGESSRPPDHPQQSYPPPANSPPAYPPVANPVPAHPQPPVVCTWHPDRQTALRCTRCGRPACPECLTPASVGFQCRACVAEGRATTRTARTVSGSPHGEQPMVTIALIAVNIVVFVITVIQAGGTAHLERSSWFREGALTPILVSSGEYWRLLSSGFLHLSVTHIGLNMLALYFVGLPLERTIGRWRFLIVYLLSLLGGSVAVMLFADPGSSAVGASGAIFGLLGALVAVFVRFRYELRQLMIVVVINLVITFAIPGISWQAHLGGLIVGGVLGAAMVFPPPKTRTAWQVGACLAVVAVLVGLLIFRDAQIGQWSCLVVPDGLSCRPLG